METLKVRKKLDKKYQTSKRHWYIKLTMSRNMSNFKSLKNEIPRSSTISPHQLYLSQEWLVVWTYFTHNIMIMSDN